jgi:uncharacterized protein YxjI
MSTLLIRWSVSPQLTLVGHKVRSPGNNVRIRKERGEVATTLNTAKLKIRDQVN